MCLECFQLFGVSLDPAHHAAIKRRPNRHVRRVTPVRPALPGSAPAASPSPAPQSRSPARKPADR